VMPLGIALALLSAALLGGETLWMKVPA
jgi:hypothetical protein